MNAGTTLEIEGGSRMPGRLPAGRPPDLGFEDLPAEPEARIRRPVRRIGPDLEDAAWLREAPAIPRPAVPQPAPSRSERPGAAARAALAEACRPGLEGPGHPL